MPWEQNVIKRNRFCYYVQNKGFFEGKLCVIVSTFLIFMFVDQLLLVDVFSQLYYLTYTKKQQRQTYDKNHYNHENQQYQFDTAISFIDFQPFPLWNNKNHLIATDFYRLTTLGKILNKKYRTLANTYLTVTKAIILCPWKHSKIAHLYIS